MPLGRILRTFPSLPLTQVAVRDSNGSPARIYADVSGRLPLSDVGRAVTSSNGTLDVWVEDSSTYTLELVANGVVLEKLHNQDPDAGNSPAPVPEDGKSILDLPIVKDLATFGDSYIVGTGGGGLLPLVAEALNARRVTDYAVGGQSIQHVIDTQIPAAITAGTHDACLLWMSGNGTASPYSESDLTTMASRMETAIQAVLAAGIPPILGLHPPVNSGRLANDTARARSILGQLADKYRLPFFDSSLIASVDTGATPAGSMFDSGHLNAIGSAAVVDRMRAVMTSRRSDNPYLATTRLDSGPTSTVRHRNAVANGLFMAAGGAFSTTGWVFSGLTASAGTNVADVAGNVCLLTKASTGNFKTAQIGGLTYANTGGATTGFFYFGLKLRSVAATPLDHRISVRCIGNGSFSEQLPRVVDSVLPADGRWRTYERIYPFPAGWGAAGSNEIFFRLSVDPGANDVTGDVCEIGQVTIRELRLPRA